MMSPRQVDCPACGAAAGYSCVTTNGSRAHSYHAARKGVANKNGAVRKLAKKAKPKPAPEPQQVDTSKLVNHIALIIDGSGSMRPLYDKAREVMNSQLQTIKKNAAANGIKTFVSLYTFGNSVHTIYTNKPVESAPLLDVRSYGYNMGMTALRDAVMKAAADFHRWTNDVNHSFLVVTVTDGMENASSRQYRGEDGKRRFQAAVEGLQKTDLWTFVYSVPPGDSQEVQDSLGAHPGNIQEWAQTERGIQRAGDLISGGLNDYYQSRTKGQRSTTTFFADLKHVDDADLENLTDVSGNFIRWKIQHDVDIRGFVNGKVHADSRVRRQISRYQQGKGYYQLTKSVLVQENKRFLIMDKKTGAIFGGEQARALAGIPLGQRHQVRPGDFKDYLLFIQSTSVNRKLIGGTVLLYETN